MSHQETCNDLRAQLEKARREIEEQNKIILRQTNDYNRVVDKYQRLQVNNAALRQSVMELRALHTDAAVYTERFTKYLNELTRP